MHEQARRSSPPNRVRSPTDRQFASGCSPRRFEPTQLPSATELWHTPARTFTVLMWRLHGRTHAGENRHPELFENITIRSRRSGMDCRDPIRLTWIFPRTHPAGRDAGMMEAADEIKTELDQLSGIVKM
jgi:hypothetical protein